MDPKNVEKISGQRQFKLQRNLTEESFYSKKNFGVTLYLISHKIQSYVGAVLGHTSNIVFVHNDGVRKIMLIVFTNTVNGTKVSILCIHEHNRS